MHIRAKAIGTGKTGDPYRVHVPSYGLHLHYPASQVAIIAIPDRLLPDEFINHADHRYVHSSNGPILVSTSDAALKVLHDAWDSEHDEQKPPFRLEFPELPSGSEAKTMEQIGADLAE